MELIDQPKNILAGYVQRHQRRLARAIRGFIGVESPWFLGTTGSLDVSLRLRSLCFLAF
ncbi:hypothetical protein GOB48_19430 [Sinorhizobium meliloti]|nr:hypothetical protein [Sinorhizobium meliloti]